MTKPNYYVANFSGGKDSTAMVLRMIELCEPLDEVICCDTTIEFPAMYRHIEKVKKVVEAAGIKFTTLRAEHDFEYYLCDHEVKNRKPTSNIYGRTGYGWAGHSSRWCTSELKKSVINDYFKQLRDTHNIIQYIGIAADEDYRLERKNNQDPNHWHPLVEWNWTEADAMEYCLAKGYDWEGLYDIFPRVSCWCCPLKSYDDLRKLREHFPDLWQELLRLDARQCKKFAHGYTVEDFDRRFALEEALTAEGESIKNKQFFVALDLLLAGKTTIEDLIEGRKGERKAWTSERN